jgi:hypothetical protein
LGQFWLFELDLIDYDFFLQFYLVNQIIITIFALE